MQILKSGYIFLAGGKISETESIDTLYFELHPSSKKILYIPMALGDDKHESCIEWFESVLAHHGKTDVLFDAIRSKESIPDLANYSSVYLGGGNTYDLLAYVYKKGLDTSLINYLNNGGIVYGGSAGAMILGKDIRTAEEENLNNSTMHKGLDILDGFSVLCHYNDDREDKKIFDISKKIQSPIFAIPNKGSIFIDLGKKSLKPFGNTYVFSDIKTTLDATNFSEITKRISK